MNEKVAIITGSSRGIGKAIAKRLAMEDIIVIINCDKNTEEGIQTRDEIIEMGGKADFIQADISDPESAEQMVDQVYEKYGHVDILVNNAGVIKDSMFEKMTQDEWDEVIDVNLNGTYNCTRATIKYMTDETENKIVNITSVVGQTGNIGQANYAASKGGIISLTKSLAKEFAERKIQINAVAPGFINTDMLRNIPEDVKRKIIQDIPMKRFGHPKEVAELVLFLCSSRSDYITGQIFNIDGGYNI